jgi:16S rRNA (guanine1207-N2)-methyltransferase
MTEPATEALAFALDARAVPAPAAPALFCGARVFPGLHAIGREWLCEQHLKPHADALLRAGLRVGTAAPDDRFGTVLILPPRQRDHARALLARGLTLLTPGGTLVAAAGNNDGARSLEADLERLVGQRPQTLSKHKARVFWHTVAGGKDDDAGRTHLRTAWQALDAITPIEDGRYRSRRGLFAWDRIDTGSALLARHLPPDLAGRVADLGAGWGYLATEVLAHCPAVGTLHLYEADARAIEPARHNVANVHRADVAVDVRWHDVAAGLPERYDAIVSNPPFHQGRADEPALGQAFIHAAADALEPDGSLWLVANRHLPYETTLARRFVQHRSIAAADGYKVLHARGVRP